MGPFDLLKSKAASKSELYDQLASQLSNLLVGERDLIANAANFSSLIFHSLPDLNWAGFYFLKDVHEFPGHIACAVESNSEIVVPLMKNGRLIGVLDLDSPSLGRFDNEDATGLEQLIGILGRSVMI